MLRVIPLLWAAACADGGPVDDPARQLPAAHAAALRAAAEATDGPALHAALAGAYAGAELTRQHRARAALQRARAATGARLQLDAVPHERVRLLSGDADRATLELHWRLVGSVTHGGHTHPRHLQAAARVEARRTADGWRIVSEQPLEVLEMP